MQFSSRLPIAVHVLLCIHTFDGAEKLTSDFLAGSVNVNPVIIRNTLGKLKAAGLVTVDAGIGGAHLAKEPKDMTGLLRKRKRCSGSMRTRTPPVRLGGMSTTCWTTSWTP